MSTSYNTWKFSWFIWHSLPPSPKLFSNPSQKSCKVTSVVNFFKKIQIERIKIKGAAKCKYTNNTLQVWCMRLVKQIMMKQIAYYHRSYSLVGSIWLARHLCKYVSSKHKGQNIWKNFGNKVSTRLVYTRVCTVLVYDSPRIDKFCSERSNYIGPVLP